LLLNKFFFLWNHFLSCKSIEIDSWERRNSSGGRDLFTFSEFVISISLRFADIVFAFFLDHDTADTFVWPVSATVAGDIAGEAGIRHPRVACHLQKSWQND